VQHALRIDPSSLLSIEGMLEGEGEATEADACVVLAFGLASEAAEDFDAILEASTVIDAL
jgi:hypothetical protein